MHIAVWWQTKNACCPENLTTSEPDNKQNTILKKMLFYSHFIIPPSPMFSSLITTIHIISGSRFSLSLPRNFTSKLSVAYIRCPHTLKKQVWSSGLNAAWIRENLNVFYLWVFGFWQITSSLRFILFPCKTRDNSTVSQRTYEGLSIWYVKCYVTTRHEILVGEIYIFIP